GRDGRQLAAKLTLFEADRRQHEYLIVWDVATGKKKVQHPLPQDFNTNGPVVWWGRGHVVLHNGILTSGKLLSLADGRFWRTLERRGPGRLSPPSPARPPTLPPPHA